MSRAVHTTDLGALAIVLRRNVARSCGAADDDRHVTLHQIADFAAKTLRHDADGFLVDQAAIDQLCHFIRLALVSSTLSEIAANDEASCAWDDNAGNMVFWKADTKNHEPDSPRVPPP